MATPETARRATDWSLLDRQLAALLDGEPDAIATWANATAFLFHQLPDVNWVGVYRLRGDELVLGPFQGVPACTRITMGSGVCGTAALRCESVLVDDVHEFPGHIVCDTASASELVVPLITDSGELLGVLDLDSPSRARFDATDQVGLERMAHTLVSHLADGS